MSNDLLKLLRDGNKMYKAALSKFKEGDPDFKLPIGIYTIKVLKSMELKVIADKACIECKFIIVKSATGEFDGFTMRNMIFLNSDFGIGKALQFFSSIGIQNVENRYQQNKNEEFISFVNEANKIQDIFAVELTYNKADYAVISILRKESGEKIVPAPTIEKIEAVETVDEISTESEIIDDFKDDDIIQEQQVEEIDFDLPVEPVVAKKAKTGVFEKYLKQLQMFVFTQDIEVEDMKKQSAEVLVQKIAEAMPEGFTDLDKKDTKLLQQVGLENLIK